MEDLLEALFSAAGPTGTTQGYLSATKESSGSMAHLSLLLQGSGHARPQGLRPSPHSVCHCPAQFWNPGQPQLEDQARIQLKSQGPAGR